MGVRGEEWGRYLATLNLKIKKGEKNNKKMLLGIVLIAGNNSSCLCACRVVMYETWGTNLADKQCRVGLRNCQSCQARERERDRERERY